VVLVWFGALLRAKDLLGAKEIWGTGRHRGGIALENESMQGRSVDGKDGPLFKWEGKASGLTGGEARFMCAGGNWYGTGIDGADGKLRMS